MEQHINQSKNILLIDDDEDDFYLLNQAIIKLSEHLSLLYLSCTDGIMEALEVSKPCLVVIDLHMPKKNGIEILKVIKLHPNYSNIPVVIWSTSISHKDILATYDTRSTYFIEKPSDVYKLTEALKEILNMLLKIK